MEHYDDCYRNGSPSHLGICPECGQYNGDCYNGLCDNCGGTPVVCPDCDMLVPFREITAHGCCETCLEDRAQFFTKKFKAKIS